MAQTVRLNWPQPTAFEFVADAAQRAVIQHGRGHLRVLAGPGTGKTSVVVAAVHERLSQGQRADSMLVLTYGRLAAEELRRRLAAGAQEAPVATTFHALAYRLLQSQQPGLRLMGAPEQDSVLREILRKSTHLPSELEPARHSRGLTEQLRSFITRVQARGLSPQAAGGDDPLLMAAAGVYGEYLDIIGFAGTMDYAELIRRATVMLTDDPPPAVAALRTVFVDEYQDTDPAQVAFLQELVALSGAQVIAVGDPDQSIYGFRGADSDGILRFEQTFGEPSCRTIALDSTRRFGPVIAALAQRVVPHNALAGISFDQTHAHRHPQAYGPAEGQVAVRAYESESAQADHIADLLRRVRAGSSEVFPGLTLDWSQMAVLVRSGQRDIPVLQRALSAAGIPTEIARDDIPLALNAAVRPLLDVLRAAADIDGGLTPERARALLGSPLAGLDARQISRLGRLLRTRAADQMPGTPPASGQLIVDCLRQLDALSGVETELAEPAAALGQILDVARTRTAAGWPTSRILDEVWRSTPWPQRLRRDALGGGRRARDANGALDAVLELFDLAEQMDRAFEEVRSVADFLEQIDDQVIPAAPNRQKAWNRNAVRLLTAHRAKGSQWPLVVVAGVQEGLWPDLRARANLFRSSGTPPTGWREQQLLEERRLFFVACTRASQAVLVCAVQSATEEGPTPSTFMSLAAGDGPVVAVQGRPHRPLTPVGVVAGLRQELDDPETSPAMRRAVWDRLQRLAACKDTRDLSIFPWADPHRWWGHRQWTQNQSPWFDPSQPLTLSASGVQSYVQCPRRWFFEKRVRASETASTRLAFGNILHLCAQAVAAGDLAPNEEDVAEVLDGVWHAVGYEPGWQARYEREQARQATERLLTWMRNTPGEFVGAEVPFDAEFPLDCGETIRVVGKADRVDLVDEQLVITDFKTGKTVTRAQVAEHIQLGLYRWVAELGALGASGQSVAQLLFLRHDPPQKQPETGAKLMRQDTADVREWLGPVLDAAAAGIRAELAVARPGPGCRNCVVATSCPADPRGQEVHP